jgi:CheY-like chemotaxis protein
MLAWDRFSCDGAELSPPRPRFCRSVFTGGRIEYNCNPSKAALTLPSFWPIFNGTMNEVLYVEDSTTSQVLMRKYLDGMVSLTVVPSLDGAIQMLRDRRFKLMITDYNFPEGNSLQLIQYARTSPVHHQMPVIVISSSMDGPMLTRILRAGANDGQAKPLRLAEFRTLVEQMLTAPYVRSLDHPVIDVTCFQWRTSSGVHEYCPELNSIVTGSTREDADNLMRAALQEHCGLEGIALGNTNDELVVRHMIHS